MDDNDENQMDIDRSGRNGEKMFTLKKWNAVAMWSWDVECDTCAICRVQVMGVYSFRKVHCLGWYSLRGMTNYRIGPHRTYPYY